MSVVRCQLQQTTDDGQLATFEMKVSLNWLKDFVETPSDPRELKRTLTNVGLGIESVSAAAGDDWVLEAEITTNRPDCLSHYGVAREIATAYRRALKRVEVTLKEASQPTADEVSIEILDAELCARYCSRVIRNVEVKPSPEWLVKRLAAVGARPINNVADVTNYVLMELGHPLHAFDLTRVRQHEIVVRRARAGESLQTLDGVERKLTQENLVIADGERAIALAGVMGGGDSGITDATKSVLLESAWFDPLSIRRTAKSQAMHTEASHRFERGADIEMAPLALNRAAALIKELAGGEILRGLLDVYHAPRRREKLSLRRGEIGRILGAEIIWEDVERILRALGFAVDRRGTKGWGVTPPSFRLDVTREVDLIEEVARHFGYDRLPARLLPAPPRSERDPLREKELALSRTLVSLGYREIITSSMAGPAENAKFSDAEPVALENPLSQEASVLRTTAIPSMLAALRWNLDRDREDLRFFEMGKVYWKDGKPQERRILSLGLSGHRFPAAAGGAAKELDFLDLKGDLESLFAGFEAGELRFTPEAGDAYEPGLRGRYFCGQNTLAAFGKAAANSKLRRPVWLAEIDLERLLGFALKQKSFRPFSKFPAVERDFSLLVPAEITYGRIAEALEAIQLDDLQSYKPADLFHGGLMGAEHYSLLLRLTLQSEDHTLSGEEIAAASDKVLTALAPLKIRLRG